MPSPILYRRAASTDYTRLGRIMYDAVRLGPSPYTEAQRKAWMAEPRKGAEWNDRLSEQTIYVAEQDQMIVGFMALKNNDYVDFAYILSEARGNGVFRALYERIERRVKQSGRSKITTHASQLAMPAFAAMGFELDYLETVKVADEKLDRFHMMKTLS